MGMRERRFVVSPCNFVCPASYIAPYEIHCCFLALDRVVVGTG
jgi:hypothetical protein